MKAHLLVLTSLILATSTYGDDHKIETLKAAPKGLSKEITAGLNPDGIRITGPDGAVCDVWLVKSLAVKPGFKPSLNVNYPFTPGQLVGALSVPKKPTYTDFRGQELQPGVYTLRYGQQPEDGNHIGTSELADFLLALPAKIDQSAKTIGDFDKLSGSSAKSVGSTHPAIFSLLPSEKTPKKAELAHDEDNEYWILNVPAAGKEKDKAVKVGLRFVAIGRALE